MPSNHNCSRPKLIKIEGQILANYPSLRPTDQCYYFLEYTARKGYSYSSENNFINNLKKPPARSNQSELGYKEKAIIRASRMFSHNPGIKWLRKTTLVPMPGSIIQGDVGYDDRILRVCKGIGKSAGATLDVRELVKQKKSIGAFHKDNRLSVEELKDELYVDESSIGPNEPLIITIIDDVVTNGTHYRAAHSKLVERFPDAKYFGFFLARTVWVQEDPDEIQSAWA